jgi:exopolysaccharide production protein ExoZ
VASDAGKLYGLQIGRGLAAFSIVYFHSWVAIMSYPEGTSYPIEALRHWGFLGVNFFFAISGYVICLVVSKSDFTIRSFFIRRFFRLYPIYWAVLYLFVKIGHTTRGNVDTETTSYLLYSATLLPTKSMPYLDVAWSLQHEVFFYIAAAIIIPIFGLRGLAIALGLSAITAFYYNLPDHNLPISRYHADFLAGTLAFLYRGRLKQIPKLSFLIAGCTLAFLAMKTVNFGLLPFASFAIVVWITSIEVRPSPISTPFIKLGDISYSLYLIHPSIFLLAHRDYNSLPLWTQEPIRWGAIALCILVSYCAWKLIEIPTIALGERLSRSTKEPHPKEAVS